jgi:undecaprenyl diphosphate synthase
MEPAPSTGGARPPVHVAIIMDGNGRWARSRGLPRVAGHRRGVDAVRRTVRAAGELGVEYLTLFSFSSENWRRPFEEVQELMKLLRFYLRNELEELHRNGVRFRMIGDRARLPDDIIALIDEAEVKTVSNKRLTLMIALSYGGRDEIVLAARKLAQAAKDGSLDPATISAEDIERRLDTAGVPDPDLLIRTSGEQRLSNFLLWQSAYAEMVFLDRLWPDFDKADLEQAVVEFQSRDRRYGSVSSR